MSFNKKLWKDYPSLETPINATELNRIEDGIQTAHSNIVDFNSRVDNIIATPTTVSEQEIIDARQGKGSLGSNLTSIKGNIEEIKGVFEDINLYDFTNAKKGYVLVPSGYDTANATYDTSDWVRVSPGTYYISICRKVSVYGDDKVLIEHFDVLPTDKKTLVIGQLGYIKVSFDSSIGVKGVISTSPNTEKPFGSLQVRNDSLDRNILQSIVKFDSYFSDGNLFDISEATDNYYVRHDLGVLVASDDYITSGYVEVEKNAVYFIKGCRKIATYTPLKVNHPDEGLDVNPSNNVSFVSPISGYMRVSIDKRIMDEYQISVGADEKPYTHHNSVLMDENVKITKESILGYSEENNIPSVLKGKSGLYFGDSITAGTINGGGFAKVISENEGMTYINDGVSGSTVGKRVGNTTSVLERVVNTSRNADYIMIAGGVNDSNNHLVPVGEISEGYNAVLDEFTFCGALESTLKTAMTKFHGKKIGFISMHKMSSRPYLKEYYDKARLICEKWSIPYCDLYSDGGLNTHIPIIHSTYADESGTHPNELGYQVYYAPKIASWMKTL